MSILKLLQTSSSNLGVVPGYDDYSIVRDLLVEHMMPASQRIPSFLKQSCSARYQRMDREVSASIKVLIDQFAHLGLVPTQITAPA